MPSAQPPVAYYIQGAVDFHELSSYGNFPEPPPASVPRAWLLTAGPAARAAEDTPQSSVGLDALESLLALRRSVRSRQQTVDGALLERCLRVAVGYRDATGLRAYPSAGSSYCVSLYCVITGNPDIHCFDPIAGRLVAVEWRGDAAIRASLPRMLRTTYLDPQAIQAAFFFVADLAMIGERYGERCYRYALLEAGHLAQNLALAFAVAGTGSCPIGGVDDAHAREVLRLTHAHRVCLYGLAVP